MGRVSQIIGTGAALVMSAAWGSAAADTPTKIVGFTEPVLIQPENIEIRAKVDTGADHSSVDTTRWETFERDGATWIRFTLSLEEGRKQTLERPLFRMASITRAGAGVSDRPVVILSLCVGDVSRQVEVNLAKRSRLTYRMLLGASFLSGVYLVDVSKNGMTHPTCTGDRK